MFRFILFNRLTGENVFSNFCSTIFLLSDNAVLFFCCTLYCRCISFATSRSRFLSSLFSLFSAMLEGRETNKLLSKKYWLISCADLKFWLYFVLSSSRKKSGNRSLVLRARLVEGDSKS